MIRKSGNRFSEKIMLKQGYETAVAFSKLFHFPSCSIDITAHRLADTGRIDVPTVANAR